MISLSNRNDKKDEFRPGRGDKPEHIKIIEKAAFAGSESVEVEMTFQAQALDGTSQTIIVKKGARKNATTIESNHPPSFSDVSSASFHFVSFIVIL